MIEAAGFSTITLSNIPDLTASAGVPRMAAISYPMNRTLGLPGDWQGQLAVLRAVVQALQGIDTPGQVVHLPFKWPETPREAKIHPAEPPPIATHLKKNIWDLPCLLKRSPPK